MAAHAFNCQRRHSASEAAERARTDRSRRPA